MIECCNQLREILKSLEDINNDDQRDSDISLRQIKLCKDLFDVQKQLCGFNVFGISELYVDGLDNEQIWQQIELVNNCLPKVIDLAKKSQKQKRKVQFVENVIEKFHNENDEQDESEDEAVNEIIKKVNSSGDTKDGDDEELFPDVKDNANDIKESEDEGDADEEADDYENEGKLRAKRPRLEIETNNYDNPLELFKKAIRNSKKSDIKEDATEKEESSDSRFFNLAKMNEFLDKQDALEGRERVFNDDDDDDDDDEEEEDEDDSDEDNPIKYDDFFDQLEVDDGDEDAVEEADEGEDKKVDSGNLSSFERRLEMMKKKVSIIENRAVADKEWHMKGEVTHADRPVNSLIDKQVEFGVATQPVLIATPEINKKIEEILCQRAISKVWDGPKRKIKTKEAAFTLNKKVVLDQEKSKLSLADIYENEYLEQLKGKEEKLPVEIEEIQSSMTSLFRKLDALSNFHFNPKPAVPDVKIISNVPAMNVEEVAPVAMTDAMSLAPEEILDKNRKELLGTTERTETDKKRANRLRKKIQHFKKLDKEERDKIKELKKAKKVMHKSGMDDHLNNNEIKKKPKKYGKKKPKHP